MPADTHFIRAHASITEPSVIDGTGYSETIKVLADGIEIANQVFIGAPREDDIDIVNRHNLVIGPNTHKSRAPQAITCKAGASGILVKGNFGKLTLGQYSNYDRWFKHPKTHDIYFAPDATGTVEIWYAKKPSYIPPGVRVKRVNPLIVYGYFLFRSIQQTFSPPAK